MQKNKVIFIVGPTAVGKTEISILLAEELNGEIISCDSMQVYKEINIASCKPGKDLLERVPHHLCNIVSIAEDFDVVTYCEKARLIIKNILSKGKAPIVVGGSGMYVSILLDGIFSGASRDEGLRKKIELQAQEKGSEYLHERLKEVDPESARRIHHNDLKRIIRALEVFETSSMPISKLKHNRDGIWDKYDIKLIALNRDRQELYQLIDKRVEKMFADGLEDEIKKLNKKKFSRTAEHIIGIKEIKDFLCGSYDIERAKHLIKRNTRHYAKRQLTWFRRDKRISWVNIKQKDSPQNIVQKIMRIIEDE